jgi:Mrp family chromosome partitioning ATPase
MSAIDRAFIRAYLADDQLDASIGLEPIGVAAARPPKPAPPVVADAASPAAPHFRIYADATAPAAPSPGHAAGGGQRRPLSAFAQPTPAIEARFRPAFEVDNFRWSEVNDELCRRHASRCRAVVEMLLVQAEAGHNLIGIGGDAVGVGCTTVLGCLARLLTEAGKSVAMVDGDFATAGLARSVGLGVDIGWEEVLAGRVPLAESVVHSLRDRISLLPLAQGGAPAAEKLDGIQASVTAGVLRYHYDIVLFDLGSVAGERQGIVARRLARRCRLDGMILTTASVPCRVMQTQWLSQTAPELAGVCLGVVENQLPA